MYISKLTEINKKKHRINKSMKWIETCRRRTSERWNGKGWIVVLEFYSEWIGL